MGKLIKYNSLIEQIGALVKSNQKRLVHTINTTITITYWQIGKYIVEFEQDGKERAEYGTSLLKNLSKDLTEQLGKGYSYRNLRLFRQFYVTFPMMQSLISQSENSDVEIWQSPIAKSYNDFWNTLSTKSKLAVEKALLRCSWTHFVRLLSIKNDEERYFYLLEAVENNWSVRELNRQIDKAVFERTVLSKGKIALPNHQNNELQPTDVLKDPYILDFLGLEENKEYSESELETAIINNLEKFLLELGKGFSFVARQYRISAGSDHFYIDLVFYNRLLQSHVLIDLKIGKLKHQDIGQMQMYVNYFDREIKMDRENPTIGIILCKEKNDFVVEYSLSEDNSQIYSKEYLLYLPNKEELKQLLNSVAF